MTPPRRPSLDRGGSPLAPARGTLRSVDQSETVPSISAPRAGSVAAVVVTFQPDPSFAAGLAALERLGAEGQT